VKLGKSSLWFHLLYGGSRPSAAGVADTDAPIISNLDPADDSTGVPVGSNFVATFNENVEFDATVGISLKLADGTPVEAFDEGDIGTLISISGPSLTINPTSDLSNSTGYRIEVDTGAIRDNSGNLFAGITDTGAWTFVTAAAPGGGGRAAFGLLLIMSKAA
jgi:hypothetical protein